jgi:hypothetical protein
MDNDNHFQNHTYASEFEMDNTARHLANNPKFTPATRRISSTLAKIGTLVNKSGT